MKDEVLSEAKAELIDLMKREGEVSVKIGAEQLDLAQSTIRQHLSGLEAKGFVDSKRQRSGVGRPTKMYSLTNKAQSFFQNRDRVVLARLMRFLIAQGHTDEIERFFEGEFDELIEASQQRLSGLQGDRRLREVCDILEEWGYYPECREGSDDELLIELMHCPYSNIVELAEAPCKYEKQLLEQLLGSELQRLAHMPDGAPCCKYKAELDGGPSAESSDE